jgi:Domain of unknown function (DUF2703)
MVIECCVLFSLAPSLLVEQELLQGGQTMRVSKSDGEKRVEIEFLYLDLEVCTRCKGTDANLETTLRILQEVLQAAGRDVATRKVLVDSEETARKLKFLSSPTIRINGRDIALKFRETPCDACAGACACDGVDCRVWVYEGKEYTEAPVPLIINALLSEIYDGQNTDYPASSRAFELSENLKHFFEAKAAKKAAESRCAAEEKTSCCGPSEKSSCCGSGEQGTAATCGYR